MELCSYCSRIPAKLFSTRRNHQCDYNHQPTLTALQQSASAGCQGCRLFARAIETSTERYAGKYALARSWEDGDGVRLSSTKFGWQVVRVGWKEAGHFRARAIPKEWSECVLDIKQGGLDMGQAEWKSNSRRRRVEISGRGPGGCEHTPPT
ncbi:hypothetical protein CDD82_7283 [Ophiocordyceps australis]|uniref:Uncharacterized protein n=1 Tax=Ophiocordyceps australis TaxID=1399860 RepID=A0A2C5XWE2_9HYPO|nr:hypothetical protein CDD82_7283 [Ophiocordyceps australis]